MRPSLLFLAAAFGLAGCMDSAGEFGWGTEAAQWTLSFSDRTDSIAIKATPDPPGLWSAWMVDRSRHALGFALHDDGNDEPRVTVGPGSAASLAPLGPDEVRVGDAIDVCAFTGDRDFPFHLGNSHGGADMTFTTLRVCSSRPM